MEEEEVGDLGGGDAPAGWIMTFADLMRLLMCFFVLLLSFSEMDVQKYKQIAGSMKTAFGGQRIVPADEIPKGTSIIAKNFSPGKPDETILSKIKQETADLDRKTLDSPTQDPLEKGAQGDARNIAKELKEEIKESKLEIESKKNSIIIKIQERDSF